MASRKRVASILAISAVAAASMLGALAGAAQAAPKHFDGTVVAKSSAAKTFQIRTQGGNKLTFKVNGSTVFERIGGSFGALKKGMEIEVEAAQTSGGLLAKKVEPRGSGGGGGNKGGGGGGHDDGPNHT